MVASWVVLMAAILAGEMVVRKVASKVVKKVFLPVVWWVVMKDAKWVEQLVERLDRT